MSEKIVEDGGPAFPIVASTGDPRDGVYCREGVSIRDYFAGKALAGIAAPYCGYEPQRAAERAYDLADAMITERNKRH